MKAVFVLLCVAAMASGQFSRFRGFRGGSQGFRGGSQGFRGGSFGRGFSRAPPSSNTVGSVDDTNGDSEYHYSWRHDNNRKYTHGKALSYCAGISGKWAPISIEKKEENAFVNKVISGDRLDYIWTGGKKIKGTFSWPTGAITDDNWSHTGGRRSPQPDNRERGGENCLAILNNFYRDGLKWHDVACHHQKPIICERKVVVPEKIVVPEEVVVSEA